MHSRFLIGTDERGSLRRGVYCMAFCVHQLTVHLLMYFWSVIWAAVVMKLCQLKGRFCVLCNLNVLKWRFQWDVVFNLNKNVGIEKFLEVITITFRHCWKRHLIFSNMLIEVSRLKRSMDTNYSLDWNFKCVFDETSIFSYCTFRKCAQTEYVFSECIRKEYKLIVVPCNTMLIKAIKRVKLIMSVVPLRT
jgi:hypothetical protein